MVLIIKYSGAFSKVYEAIKLETNENVAIKIVRKLELNNQQVKKKQKQVTYITMTHSIY